MKIHLLGPSGSGTSTLGRALSDAFDCAWLDTDDFFWEKTNPPYITQRPIEGRRAMLEKAVSGVDSWVLSGSMLGWGDWLKNSLDLVIYKYVVPAVRLERLRKREAKRYGKRIRPGGEMHSSHLAFLEWAAAYEDGGMDRRSRVSELAWLEDLKCPVIRIEEELPLSREIEIVCSQINKHF